MVFVPFASTVKVFMKMTWRGQSVGFTFHVQMPGGVSTVTMNALASLILTWWNSTGKTLFSVDITLDAIEITDLSSVSAPGITLPVSPAVAGTISGVSAPNNVTVALSLRTSFRGRSYRGRIFMPGLANSQISGTFVTTSYVTAVLAGFNALITALTGAGHVLVVASRYTAGAPRAVGVTSSVTALQMETVIDSQRRRLPGRGA